MTSEQRTISQVLILDDNPGDALLVKQLLDTLPEQRFRSHIHHSTQGILPSGELRPDLILLAQNYAHTELPQLLTILRSLFADVPVILLADADPQPQELMAATQAGLKQILYKRALSRESLQQSLGGIQGTVGMSVPLPVQARALETAASASRQPPPSAAPSPTAAETSSGLKMPAAEPGAQQRPAPGPAAATGLDQLQTAVIHLQRQENSYWLTAMNTAAARLESLDKGLQSTEIRLDQHFAYQNLDLATELANLPAGESRLFREVLRVDAQGQASWRDLSITAVDAGHIILELHDASHRMAEERTEAKDTSIWQNIWQNIVASLPHYMAVLNEEGSIVELVSGDWSQIQRDGQELEGQTLSSLLHEDQRQLSRDMLSKALNTGKAQQAVFTLELSDGPLWLDTRLSLLRSDASTERFALLIASDISELFEQHSSVSAELETMKEFYRRAPFALAIKDADGRFERANPYFLDLFGLRSNDVIGKNEADLFDDVLADELNTLELKMQRSQDVVEAHFQVDPDDWMVYRFIKLPLHSEDEFSQASCLLVLPSDGEDQLGQRGQQSRTPAEADSGKKKSPQVKTSRT